MNMYVVSYMVVVINMYVLGSRIIFYVIMVTSICTTACYYICG